MNRKVSQNLWVGFYVLNGAVIGYFWSTGYGELALKSSSGLAVGLGGLFGLLGAYSLLWQLLLMSRLRPLEASFGRLRLTALHRLNGYLAFSFLIVHPFLLTVGYSAGTTRGLWGQFLRFASSFHDVLNAVIGLALIIILVSASVGIARRKLSHESWYFVHLSSYLAVILAFGHQTAVGGDFLGRPLFVTYWDLLYLLVGTSIAYFRIATPLYRLWRHRFQVVAVKTEAPDTVSIYIGGSHMEEFKFQAGQFARWRFLAHGLWWQSHPFSFSHAYDGKTLRLTVKAVGDYTATLQKLNPGTPLIIDGPHGIFTPELAVRPSVVLIAGGIGITPLYCMLDELIARRLDVTLLYSAATPSGLLFRPELEEKARRLPGFAVHFFSGHSPGEGVIASRITGDHLVSLVPELASSEVYLCGPASFMESMDAALTQAGVSPAHIHSERFAY